MSKTQIAMIVTSVILGGVYAFSFIPATAGWGYPGYQDEATAQSTSQSGSYYRGGSGFFFFSGGNGQVFQEAPSVRQASTSGPGARGSGLSGGK